MQVVHSEGLQIRNTRPNAVEVSREEIDVERRSNNLFGEVPRKLFSLATSRCLSSRVAATMHDG